MIKKIKIMVQKLVFISVVFAVFATSCTYYNEKDLYPEDVCDTTNISYTNDILPIFEKDCYACHYGNVTYGNLDLSKFDHIQNAVDDGDLLRNIKHEPGGIPMPKGGSKLSDCKTLKIEQWINMGIPNN